MEALEHQAKSSVAYQYARYALAMEHDMIPSAVLHAAKRSLLDTLGVAIGAFDAPGFPMMYRLARGNGGPGEATVFGSGFRATAGYATLANSFLVRFLDYNDCGGGGHNSDSIPCILAVSEKYQKSGRDFLTAVILSYELGSRFCSGALLPFYAQDFIMDIRCGVTLPPPVGRLMGMNAMQIANAIGVCASHSLPLGILDTNREANYNVKNLRVGFVARDAIDACLLAEQGFTGPVRIVEGEHGLCDVVLKGQADLEKMVNFSGWRMLDVRYKDMCCNANSMGHVMATLQNVIENDIHYEDVEAIKVVTGMHESRHTTSLWKKYPLNAETADHSAFFTNAVAIKERRYDVQSMHSDHFTDPDIIALIDKMQVIGDPALPEYGFVGISEITVKDGRTFIKRVEKPHGFGDDPHTDRELEQKFRSMACRYFSDAHIDRLIDMVWNVETLPTMEPLVQMMILKDDVLPASGS